MHALLLRIICRADGIQLIERSSRPNFGLGGGVSIAG